MNDLQEVNEKVKIKTLELRKERVRLIKLKVDYSYIRSKIFQIKHCKLSVQQH